MGNIYGQMQGPQTRSTEFVCPKKELTMLKFMVLLFAYLLYFESLYSAPNLTPHKPAGWDDTIVVSLSTSTHIDDQIMEYKKVFFDFAWINNGDIDAGSFSTCILIDDVLFKEFNSSLQKGVFIQPQDMEYTFTTAGVHRLKITVDCFDTITENDENDNTYQKTITVQPDPRPNLVDVGMEFHVFGPSIIKHGQTLTIKARVANNGNDTAGSFKVLVVASEDTVISAADSMLGQVTMEQILAGQEKELLLTSNVPNIPYGSYYIGLILDQDSDIDESLEQDNVSYIHNNKLIVSASSPNKLLAFWAFDELSGNTAIDSADTNTGTINGATRVAGKQGTALQFDGKDNGVTVDNPFSGIQVEFTFSCWININAWPDTTPGNVGTIYRHRANNNDFSMYFKSWLNASKTLRIGLTEPGGEHGFESSKIFSLATWYHIAFVYDGFTKQIFIDGVLDTAIVDTFNKDWSLGYHRTDIGDNSYDTNSVYGFNGIIDEFKIYDYAISGLVITTSFLVVLSDLPFVSNTLSIMVFVPMVV